MLSNRSSLSVGNGRASRRVPSLLFALVAGAMAVLAANAEPARGATITLSSPSISAGYALAFGGLNHLDTGFPVTRDACRFLGNSCAVSYKTSVSVGQFDSSLGTLQQVDIRYITRSSFSARIQNRHGFGNPPISGTWSVGFDGLLLSTIELAAVIANDTALPSFAPAFPGDPIGLSGFDYAVKPFGTSLGTAAIFDSVGASDVTNLMHSSPVARSVSSSFSDAATLAAFTGSGSLQFDVAEHTASRASSNSNSAYSISRVSIAGPSGSVPFINTFIINFAPLVEVTYTYDVASSTAGTGSTGGTGSSGDVEVPEPSSGLLLAAGLIGWGSFRRRLRKA